MAESDEPRKVKVLLDEDVVLSINALKKVVGETYSDTLRRVIADYKTNRD